MKNFIFLLCLLLPFSAFSECDLSIENQSVMIGDSHVLDYFGKHIETILNEKKLIPTIKRFAFEKGRAKEWLQSQHNKNTLFLCPPQDSPQRKPKNFPLFKDLLSQKPKTLIIALGTYELESACKAYNKAGTPLLSEKQKMRTSSPHSSIKKMISQIPEGTKCFWIGPPSFAPETLPKVCQNSDYQGQWIRDLEKIVTEKCLFIDSRNYKSYQPHFTSKDCLESPNRPSIQTKMTEKAVSKLSPKDCCLVSSNKPLPKDLSNTLRPDQKNSLFFSEDPAKYWATCVASDIEKILEK